MSISWESLKTARPDIFGHPATQPIIEGAWAQFTANNPPDHDVFAQWLTLEGNWQIFINQFETASGVTLAANVAQNPTFMPPVTPKPVFAARHQVGQTPIPANPPPATPKPASNAPKQTHEPGILAWNRNMPKWSPANVFHEVTESAWIDVIARGYDVITNLIGLPILAGQLGMTKFEPLHYLVFFVGAVAISFIEVMALKALAQAISLHKEKQHPDEYIDLVYKFAKGIFVVFFCAGMLLWMVDLYLSVLPWAQAFNMNPIGWLTGIVLSLYVEYVEVDSHIKTLRTLQGQQGKNKEAAKK